MTTDEYKEIVKNRKKRKYGNHFVYIFSDGFVSKEKKDEEKHGEIVDFFASVKEYERWCELKLWEKAGKITELNKQVPFLLSPAFVSGDGKKQRPTYYNADFVYVENGKQIVEDVKAMDKKTGKYITTRLFNFKWKLLQMQNPEYVFRIY